MQELVHRAPSSAIRIVVIALLGWAILNAAIIVLAHGFLPFDRPNLITMPFWLQVAMPSFGLIEQLALMGVVALMTRKRPSTLADRTPTRGVAGREVAYTLVYAMIAQAGGWIIGPAFGFRPFSFHIAGTLVGCSTLASPAEATVWASYNFIAFAIVPYLWFRRRYSNYELCLVFDGPGNDLLVVLVVLVIESAVQLATMKNIFALPLSVMLVAAPLSFTIFLFGTVLPTMILVYAILLPRYYKLTGSVPLSVILGGLTYASLHLVEGWSAFDTPEDTALSILFVFLSYTGPGMFKSYVTLRTGNAWVHALGYHAVAPHTIIDAPMIARVFRLI